MKITVGINVQGSISPEDLDRSLRILGELIINEIKNKIRRYSLIDTGDFLQQWFATVNNGTLTIENAKEYAVYLEFGTYDYFEQYGTSNYPESPTKKKDLPPSIAKNLPKGMAPFAPVRRTLYDQRFMQRAANAAFS